MAQIFESCTRNIYIANDDYFPERCETCGDSDTYIGIYDENDIEEIANLILEKLNCYNEEMIKEILNKMNKWRRFKQQEINYIKDIMLNQVGEIIVHLNGMEK